MMRRSDVLFRNLWGLAVLCLLDERPMHPYEMQRVLRQRHKDELLPLKHASLYHAVERLEKAGCIEAVEKEREGARPERTVYRLTPAGAEELHNWLSDLLARPGREPSDFTAAISFLSHLDPQAALISLTERLALLEADAVSMETLVQKLGSHLGRLPLLEVEYALAVRHAEIEWVRAITAELRSGALTWGASASPPHQETIAKISQEKESA